MRNTLFDTALGDVNNINMPIGQSTAYAATVSVLTATSVSVKSLQAGSVANNIASAATTDTFAAAVALTAQVNAIGTVGVGASTAAPFALPSVAVALGAPITVLNQTTRSVAVWPQPLDIIDVVATSGPVILGIGHRCVYYPVGTTQWISAQMGVTSA